MDDRSNRRSGYALTIPDALLNSDAMRRACAARDFQEVFRLINRRTGSSHAVMASAIGRMTSSRVSDVIRGVRGIRGQEVIERICDGFGIPGEMLGVSTRGWEKTSSLPVVGATEAFLAEGDDNLDLVEIATLRQQVQILDSRYATEPSAGLVAETGRILGKLTQGHGRSSSYLATRDLHAALAETSMLMGQLVWDASGRTDHSNSRIYFDRAVAAAQELRDPVPEGLALLRTAFISLYGDKNPSAGLKLTEQAAAKVKGVSNVLSGLAYLHSAEAHAMLRQRKECERSLREAEQFFERVGVGDSGSAMISPGQFGRLAGSCFLFLGDASRAEALLAETSKKVREKSKSQAIVLGNLALAQIRRGAVDEATGTLHKAIEVVECNRGGGGLNLIFRAGRELQSWNDLSDVRNLNDRLFGLIAVD
ncbi:transcriptional regulator [Streptomyces niveiscabiei]|uniref:transcriptional regulator n=1 Tax=Streptomyces niveiscabiei TaxID=164115 RepID=UPI0029A30E27|nr:transcriptional regulator [Streptomyces niveiscabiei]MDX3380694.1 transcriptional regulator [Streptomyces niveiscabiei]